jgi:transcriptional antiterminator NusG
MEYRWYAIQTTAGHENKVRSLIQKRIEDDPRPAEEKLIRQALVPTQDVIEIKNGKKVTVERKLFPGYVLVDMQMGQEALHVVNSIQGVIKFVGSGKLPQPLRQDEVNRLLGVVEAVSDAGAKEEIPFLIGQVVEITEGPFSDFSGTVEEVLSDKGKVKVSVSLFGRPTSVEMDYLQLRGH